LLDQLSLDVRHGLRILRNAPGFTAIAILSLALGIGANTAIFTILNAVLLKPLPVLDPQALVHIVAGTKQDQREFTTAMWQELRDRKPLLDIAAWAGTTFDLAAGGERHAATGRYVSGSFFRTLGVDAAIGRTLQPSDDQRGGGPDGPVAVLSHDFWQRQYGGGDNAANVIGRSIRLNGRAVTIVGVMPRGFFGTEVGTPFDVAVPLEIEPLLRGRDSQFDSLNFWWLNFIGRLRPDQTLTQARADLNVLTQAIVDAAFHDASPDQRRSHLAGPLDVESMATGTSTVRDRYSTALLIVSAIVGIVLLIACTNLASLWLARATARQHELAVRLALGAGRARLVRQLLIESLMVAIAGALLGLFVARWASTLLLTQLSSRVWRITLDVDLDWRVLLFTGAVALLTAILCGLAPAWRSTNVNAIDALKRSGGSGGGRSPIGGGWRGFSAEKLLLIAQIALSLVLVIGAALFVRSFIALTTVDAGFDPRGVLLIDAQAVQANDTPAQRRERFAHALEALEMIPGVQHTSASVLTPMGTIAWSQRPLVDSGPGAAPREVRAFFNRVSEHYFETMSTPLLKGRAFNANDILNSPPVAIVNETFARTAWPGEDPIGHHLLSGRPSSPEIEVVGLVKDSKYRGLREPAPPTVFLALPQDAAPFASITYELRSTMMESGTLARAVKDTLQRTDPQLSLELRPFTTQIDDNVIRERVLAMLSTFFGTLTLLLAGIGLYGMMSLAVTRRRQELGIRLALGASPREIVRLVLRDVALITSVGLLAGTAIAFASGRLVTSMLFGLTATDPTTCALAIALLATVALLAGYLPARRAARLDPMIALRDE
jgi:putative ABC transport system permease protein